MTQTKESSHASVLLLIWGRLAVGGSVLSRVFLTSLAMVSSSSTRLDEIFSPTWRSWSILVPPPSWTCPENIQREAPRMLPNQTPALPQRHPPPEYLHLTVVRLPLSGSLKANISQQLAQTEAK